jgi:hypothetical protein
MLTTFPFVPGPACADPDSAYNESRQSDEPRNPIKPLKSLVGQENRRRRPLLQLRPAPVNKPLGCLSIYGLVASFVLAAAVGVIVWLGGAVPFGPGPLTASAPQATSLQGYTSHADMEQQCTLCHRPWTGVDPARCVACRTPVQAEIAAQNGLHGQLKDPMACAACHPDHQGREAEIALARPSLFRHDLGGFTLRRHTQLADGTPLSCENCHTPGYAFVPSICDSCHRQMDAASMDQHTAGYGASCISCHDGSTLPAPFDHQAVFLLDGAHAQAECTACLAAQRG